MPMPGFAKSPPELVERFNAITADLPEAERRLMFGYPALFVGGNMVSGLYESSWHVRLGDAAAAELLAIEGAGPLEIMPGRAMVGYVAMPQSIIADDTAVRAWLDRAIAFGRGLPPKVAKARTAKRPKGPGSTPA
jgi:TfoX/Sxy family transcriptional regulator of competence genes